MKKFFAVCCIMLLVVSSEFILNAQTWTLPATGTFTNVQSGVVFLSPTNAIVVGGYTQPRVRKTTDGGASWTTTLSTTSYYRLNAVCFTSTTNGYAVGDIGTLLHTVDGGDTWSFQANPVEPTYQYLYGVSFYDATHGIAVGSSGSLIYTMDGSTWSSAATNPGLSLNAVSMYSATHAVAVGTSGAIVKTTNGGVDWTTITAVNSNSLTAIKFFNGSTGVAVGLTGTILRTTDGGDSWAEISAPAASAYRAISFYNSTNGIIAGDGPKLAKTTDGGLTWTALPVTDFSGSTYFTGISFIDQDHGIAVGSNNSSGYIYYTTNGALPVELVSFTATAENMNVHLQWNTSTEVNNAGFQIERRTESGAKEWKNVGFVEGNGSSNAQKEYSFTEKIPSSALYVYRLKQIDRDGKHQYSKEVEVNVSGAPKQFSLEQNYPNPFNPSTHIEFTVPSTGRVMLKIVNIVGQEMVTLYDGTANAGEINRVEFSADHYSGGVYFAILQQGERRDMKKMLLIK